MSLSPTKDQECDLSMGSFHQILNISLNAILAHTVLIYKQQNITPIKFHFIILSPIALHMHKN